MSVIDIRRAANANWACCQQLFLQLAAAGVVDICICPGSRSAPLAIAANTVAKQLAAGIDNPDERPCFDIRVHLDERAAAFYALGLAKASGRPVALVCTSGTALANFLPAVIEAHHSAVPLIVLSADRPSQLRDWGAGQTIDQSKLFGAHVRWFAEAPIPAADEDILSLFAGLARRAVQTAQGYPAGPVHLNFPFREPLAPTAVVAEQQQLLSLPAAAENLAAPQRCQLMPDDGAIAALARRLQSLSRSLIIVGQLERADCCPATVDALTQLATRLNCPVLADACSQLRFAAIDSEQLINHSQLLLSDEQFASEQAPELVLLFGAPSVSKAQRLWLKHQRCELILIDPQRRWNNPDHLAASLFDCSHRRFAEALNQALVTTNTGPARAAREWLARWRRADTIAADVIDSASEHANNDDVLPITEAAIGAALIPLLAAAGGSALFLSNSMAIRDIDCFARGGAALNGASLPVFCNRGANGIDGILSTALGVAAAVNRGELLGCEHSLLLCGDLTFLHDIGGLLAARQYPVDLTLLVINNDGGGIFSFLPVADAAEAEDFEQLFITSHGLELSRAAELYRLGYRRVETMAALADALTAARQRGGVQIVEAAVDRERSVSCHRAIVAAVHHGLAAAR